MSTAVPRVAVGLGWAGLLPFVAAPVALVLLPDAAALVVSGVATYALAILCFLAGAWWGIALLRRYPGVLIASNAVVIAGWLGYLFLPPDWALCLLALLLAATVLFERSHPMFRPQPAYYAALRLRLSVVATPSLLASALLL